VPDRARIVGTVLFGVATGLATLLALARPLSPGEVALVHSGGERELVRGGWVIEAPWVEVGYYRLSESVEGSALFTSADKIPLRVEWSALRTLDAERLPEVEPEQAGWDRLAPRLLIASALTRLGGEYAFDEIYGIRRPELTGRVLGEVGPVLEGLAVGLAELRLTSVRPLGDVAEQVPLQPPRLLILALDNLDRETVERLVGDGRLPVIRRLGEAGTTLRLENPRPEEPPAFWREILTGGVPAGNWVERRARRGWPTGVVHSPLPPRYTKAEELSREGAYTPLLAALVEGYAGPVYAPPDPGLLAGEAGLEAAVERAIEGSRAAGALLDAGAAAVLWGEDLFKKFYDALWPLVQRYRSVGYGERFPAEVHLAEADLIRAAEFGALAERLLTALDRLLGELLARHPDLTIIVVSSGGYGPRPPEGLSSAPWGPTGGAWMLLAGPHVRPLGEREGTPAGTAALLGELVLCERLSEAEGIGEREILEPWYRERLTLGGPPAVDSRGGENYTQRARSTGAETNND
jgi:hypothetical protein